MFSVQALTVAPRPHALMSAVVFAAALVSAPVEAHEKQRPQKSATQLRPVTPSAYGVRYQKRTYRWSGRIKKHAAKARPMSFDRNCLTPDTRSLLSQLESRFGRMTLVSTCRVGARMPSGDVSWHARHRAFDFVVPKGVDKRDVMVWLGKNSPGVTISYRSMAHIHTDTGSFRKIIYNAANPEAGQRAVAIWKAREALASATQSVPQPEKAPAPMRLATADPLDPLHEFAVQPAGDRRPEPIGPQARRDIFRRYIESKDVVVMAHTSLTCPNGAPFPDGLTQLLSDAASHFGRTAYVNSGYRTPERNRRVGGARHSQHMECRAIDFRIAGISVGDLRRYVVANLNRWAIRGLGTYATHLHADVGLRKATRLVTWTGGHRRHAKRRHPRYASAS